MRVKITKAGKLSVTMAKSEYIDFIIAFDYYMGVSGVYIARHMSFDCILELEKLADAVLHEMHKRFNRAMPVYTTNTLLLSQSEARALLFRKSMFRVSGEDDTCINLLTMELGAHL